MKGNDAAGHIAVADPTQSAGLQLVFEVFLGRKAADALNQIFVRLAIICNPAPDGRDDVEGIPVIGTPQAGDRSP